MLSKDLKNSSALTFSKGPKQPPPPTRVSDNLRSEDSVEVLIGLGEGPWAGLHDGLKSFFIANTPLMASDGTLNFPDAQLIFHKGSQLPDPVKYALGGSASGTSVGVNLAQNTPVIRTTTSGNIDAIDVRLRIDQLLHSTEDGDKLNLDLLFRIEVKPTNSGDWQAVPPNTGWLQNYTPPTPQDTGTSGFFGSLAARIQELQDEQSMSEYDAQVQAWQEYQNNVDGPIDTSLGVTAYSQNVRVYGATQSPTMKEIRVPVVRNPTDTYDIRVTKISAETDNNYIRELTWDTFEEIVTDEKSYPNTAMAQVLVTASDQLSNVPQMYGIYDTLEVLVPTIFDPETRSYDYSGGPWDGTFKKAFTDDLAWIIYDLVHNDEHGIAAYYPINFSKWEAEEASLYWNACNPVTGAYVGVPRPNGGTRPRVTFNGLIDQPRNSMELLTYMAGAGNAVFYEDVQGNFRLRVEQDTDDVQVFTNMDVQNGKFQYSFTDLNTRYNDITVVYRNKKLPAYQEDRRRIFDQSDIDTHGRKPLTFAAVGCVDTDEAIARAYHKLVTSLTETRQVSFVTTRFGAYVEPHDIILIADEDMDEGYSRRVTSVTNSNRTLVLNEAWVPESGVTDYIVRIQTPTGLQEFQVDESADNNNGAQLTVTSDIPSASLPDNFSISISSASQGDVRPYRVIAIEMEEDEKVKISAIEVNRAKYALIDNYDGSVFDADDPDEPVVLSNAVQELAANVVERTTDNGRVRDIELVWESPVSGIAGATYEVIYDFDNGEDRKSAIVSSTNFIQKAVPAGKHTFTVTTKLPDGRVSPESRRIRVTTDVPSYGFPSVTNVSLQNRKDAVGTYIGQNAQIEWSFEPVEAWTGWDTGIPHPEFAWWEVDVVNPSNGSIVHTYQITDWNQRSLEITYDQLKTFGLGNNIRNYSVVVSMSDSQGNEGASFSRTIIKPAPVLQNVSITQPNNLSVRGKLNYDTPTDPDFRGVKVWLSLSADADQTGTVQWDGDGTPVLDFVDGTNHVSYVPKDVFGTVGVNIVDTTYDATVTDILQSIQDVQDDVDDAHTDIATNTQSITDLNTVFGSTVSAAQSASDAAAARDAAQTARDASISARDAAQTALAGATGAQSAAEAARDLSISARNASQSARDAAQSAQSASETARNNAQTAETNANAARNLAETAALSASQSEEVTVSTVMENVIPSSIGDGKYHTHSAYTGTPETRPDLGSESDMTLGVDGDGKYVEIDGTHSTRSVFTKAGLPLVVGNTYRVYGSSKAISDNPNFALRARFTSGDYSTNDGISTTTYTSSSTTEAKYFFVDYTATQADYDAGKRWIKGEMYFSTSNTGTKRVYELGIEDRTQAKAAEDAASASATSAQSAAASDTSAGQQAAAADTARIAAQTAQANAETAETNAATSETNAAGSASAASTSQNNAANSATQAGNSASAAAGSASTASTKATEAAQSAAAADSDRLAAQTARSAAQTAETNAAQSATDAAGSASTASSSASNAAQSATDAGDSATAASNSASLASTKATEAGTSASSAASSALNAEVTDLEKVGAWSFEDNLRRWDAHSSYSMVTTDNIDTLQFTVTDAWAEARSKKLIKIEPNSTYKFSYDARYVGTVNPDASGRYFTTVFDNFAEDGTGVTDNIYQHNETLTDAWQSFTFTGNPTGPFSKFRFYQRGDNLGSGVIQIRNLRVYDATSELASATSAAASATSASAALAAQTAAGQSASSATTQANNAATSAGNASSSASSAAQSATDAQSSANNASSSASNAATSANNAGQSASAASTSASNASTQATNAAQSASAAAASAVTASTEAANSELEVIKTLPSTFEDGRKYYGGGFVGTPQSLPDVPSTWVETTINGIPVLKISDISSNNSAQYIMQRGVFSPIQGRTYRLRITYMLTNQKPTSGSMLSAWFRNLNDDYTYAGSISSSGTLNASTVTNKALNEWHVLETPIITADGTVPLFRAGLYARWDCEGPNVDLAIRSIEVEDLTEQLAAETHANSAASSASSASASNNSAGQSAAAAQLSETNAATSAGNASSSETSAANSATQAGNSASNASTSATNAANSATQAGASATAASNSASTALTHANAAGVSASAASASEVSVTASRAAVDRLNLVEQGQYSFEDNLARWSGTTAFYASNPPNGNFFNSTIVDGIATLQLTPDGTQGFTAITSRKAIRTDSSRNLRLSFEARLVGSVTPDSGNYFTINSLNYDDNENTVSNTDYYSISGLTANWQSSNFVFTTDGPLQKLRIYHRPNTTGSGVIQIRNLRLEDATESINAASSATAAASSASTAAASETAAGQSATSAQTQANNAATSASQASVSAGSASTAASNAAGSASSASSSANVAANALTAAERATREGMPTTFEDSGKYFTNLANGEPHSAQDADTSSSVNTAVLDSDGYYLANSSSTTQAHIFQKKGLAYIVGDTYKVTTRVRRISGSGTNLYIRGRYVNADYSSNQGVAQSGQFLPTTTAEEYSYEFTATQSQYDTGTRFVKSEVLLNNSLVGRLAVYYLNIENISAQKRAEDAATSAATSASNAAASETAAGSFATSASNSANTASTQAGNASVSASQAASSATSAAGSASAAAASQSLVATAEQNVEDLTLNALPSTFEEGLRFWTGNTSGSPSSASAVQTPWVAASEGGIPVIKYPSLTEGSSLKYVLQRGLVKPVQGRRYAIDVTWMFKGTVTGTDWLWSSFFRAQNEAHGYTAARGFATMSNNGKVANTWYTDRVTIVDGNDDAYWRAGIYNRADFSHGTVDLIIRSIKVVDITEETNAAGSATAAATSASQAAASATTAGSHATTASTQANTASTAASNASVSASQAASSASSAQGHANSAAASATQAVNASTGRNLLKNARFLQDDNFGTISQSGHSTNYTISYRSLPSTRVLDGGEDRTWAFYQGDANSSGYLHIWGEEVLVQENKVYVASCYAASHRCDGSIRIRWTDVNGTFLGYSDGANQTIPNAGPNGGLELSEWQRIFVVGTAPANAHTGRVVYFKYPTISGSDSWLFLTRQQFAEGQTGQTEAGPWSESSREAEISTLSSALIDANGNVGAYWLQELAVNGFTGAFMSARVTESDGTVSSDVSFGAREIGLYNEVDGTWLKAMRVSGGDVRIAGNLEAGAGIFLGTGAGRWAVALEDRIYNESDGTAINFGGGLDLGDYDVDFSTIGLDELGSGEAYRLRAINKTGTGFTAELKITTTGATTSVTESTNATSPSGPQHMVAKADSSASYNDVYNFFISGTISITGFQEGELRGGGSGPTQYWGNVTVETWFHDGSAWVQGPSKTLSHWELGINPTHSSGVQSYSFSNRSFNVNYTSTIRTSSSAGTFGATAAFGGTLTDLNKVTYTKQGQSGTRSATPNGELCKITVKPRNQSVA